jgi:hypothetical protein
MLLTGVMTRGLGAAARKDGWAWAIIARVMGRYPAVCMPTW